MSKKAENILMKMGNEKSQQKSENQESHAWFLKIVLKCWTGWRNVSNSKMENFSAT